MARRELALIALALAACKQRAAPPPPPAGDAIPRTTVPIKIDGEWDEDDWPKRALRHQFLGGDGQLARPSSEVRFLHDADTLYVGLYAADEDIRSTDAFDVAIGALVLRVDVTGKVTPATPGVRAAVDHDGTLDDAHDDDEEWVVELAVPLAAAVLPAQVRASRCDTTKDGVQRCGEWHGTLRLE